MSQVPHKASSVAAWSSRFRDHKRRPVKVAADNQFLGVDRCPFHVPLPCGADEVNEGVLDGVVVGSGGALQHVRPERYLEVVGGHGGVALVGLEVAGIWLTRPTD